MSERPAEGEKLLRLVEKCEVLGLSPTLSTLQRLAVNKAFVNEFGSLKRLLKDDVLLCRCVEHMQELELENVCSTSKEQKGLQERFLSLNGKRFTEANTSLQGKERLLMKLLLTYVLEAWPKTPELRVCGGDLELALELWAQIASEGLLLQEDRQRFEPLATLKPGDLRFLLQQLDKRRLLCLEVSVKKSTSVTVACHGTAAPAKLDPCTASSLGLQPSRSAYCYFVPWAPTSLSWPAAEGGVTQRSPASCYPLDTFLGEWWNQDSQGTITQIVVTWPKDSWSRLEVTFVPSMSRLCIYIENGKVHCGYCVLNKEHSTPDHLVWDWNEVRWTEWRRAEPAAGTSLEPAPVAPRQAEPAPSSVEPGPAVPCRAEPAPSASPEWPPAPGQAKQSEKAQPPGVVAAVQQSLSSPERPPPPKRRHKDLEEMLVGILREEGEIALGTLRTLAKWRKDQGGKLIHFVGERHTIFSIRSDCCPDLTKVSLWADAPSPNLETKKHLERTIRGELQRRGGTAAMGSLGAALQWRQLHKEKHGKLRDFLVALPAHFAIEPMGQGVLRVSLASTLPSPTCRPEPKLPSLLLPQVPAKPSDSLREFSPGGTAWKETPSRAASTSPEDENLAHPESLVSTPPRPCQLPPGSEEEPLASHSIASPAHQPSPRTPPLSSEDSAKGCHPGPFATSSQGEVLCSQSKKGNKMRKMD